MKWKEDIKGQPYTITKKVGPVNYAIRNSIGVEKVYHRNFLKPAAARSNASFQATGNRELNISEHNYLFHSCHTASKSGTRTYSGPIIDQQALSENFFRDRQTVSMPLPVEHHAAANVLLTSRYGRTYKPVSRLIDEVAPGV